MIGKGTATPFTSLAELVTALRLAETTLIEMKAAGLAYGLVRPVRTG
ncbi:MAG: hypothetical protein U1E15_08745 [Hyphomicrobiales bacterium]